MSGNEEQPIIDQEQTDTEVETKKGIRKRMLQGLAVTVMVAACAAGGYWKLCASRYEATDNSYAAVEVAQVTPEVSGTVREVRVVDTQKVKKGEVLVVLNEDDARLALAQAEAEYGRAVRKVRGFFATDTSLGEQVAAQDANIQRTTALLHSAEADMEKARIDLDRRKALTGSGSVSQDELTRAQNAYVTAHANIEAARAAAAQAKAGRGAALGSRKANQVLIDDSTTETNPEVAVARARRDQARLDLERMIIRAPVDGVVARRQVQVGQRVQAGAPLLSVVPLHDMHVDANFKEVQLEKVKVGQKAELYSDLYGKNVKYHGVVTGFSGGTGAAFSVIPAQNATGNWIKVVQRLPLRISLDKTELEAHPLQVGLSMHVKIDTKGEPVSAADAGDAGKKALN
jgi:membrane fusion protein (multidrug efflux system)